MGGGSVGLLVAARLAEAGHPLLLVTRSPEQANRIAHEGVQVEDPASHDVRAQAVACAAGLEAAADRIGPEPVLLCVRSTQTREVADALARAAPGALPVSVQNGVENEALLAERFPSVLGAVFRPTCTRIGSHRVRALPGGRIVVGLHPAGHHPAADALAATLREAGWDAGVSSCIQADKWLKLCINLMSAPNALVRREDHATPAFVSVKVRLLEEARDVLRAARVEARSGDGRDRSLDDEIAWQRSALARGASARRLPLYNHVWTALRHGRPLESDRFHEQIAALGAAHGVATPVNERVLRHLREAAARGAGPESCSAADLLGERGAAV